MSKFTGRYDQDVPDGRAFASSVIGHRKDMLLRSKGFRIERRPEGKPAIWSRGGERYTEQEALEQVRKEQKPPKSS